MKSINYCKIVQDLLPNYIEKLTSEETNDFINEHLENCDECSQMLENMKMEIDSEEKKQEKRRVKYMKKFNSRFRILKIILAIVLVIIAILVIHTLRNLIIINNLKNAIKPYSESTNYTVHSANISNATNSKIDITVYKKGEKFVRIMERTSGGATATISEYYNGKTTTVYVESQGDKVVRTEENIMEPNITSSLDMRSTLQTLLLSFVSKIRSAEYNGKDCYVFSNAIPNMLLSGLGDDVIYYEKDTGLFVNSIYGDMLNEQEYEFNNVDDSVFIEPDASEYLTEEEAREKYFSEEYVEEEYE